MKVCIGKKVFTTSSKLGVIEIYVGDLTQINMSTVCISFIYEFLLLMGGWLFQICGTLCLSRHLCIRTPILLTLQKICLTNHNLSFL